MSFQGLQRHKWNPCSGIRELTRADTHVPNCVRASIHESRVRARLGFPRCIPYP